MSDHLISELCTHRLRTDKRCGRPATIRLYYRAADGWRASNMFACATHQHLDIPSDSLRHVPLGVATSDMNTPSTASSRRTKPMLTQLQRESLLAALAAHRRGEWHRARTSGERVTLASLESKGLLERRAWRGDGVNRNSAFEYRASAALLSAIAPARPAGTDRPNPATPEYCCTHRANETPAGMAARCDCVMPPVTDHLARCVCGHTAAQHHPVRFGSRCRACAQCLAFTPGETPK
jgi:hypothetical protein